MQMEEGTYIYYVFENALGFFGFILHNASLVVKKLCNFIASVESFVRQPLMQGKPKSKVITLSLSGGTFPLLPSQEEGFYQPPPSLI